MTLPTCLKCGKVHERAKHPGTPTCAGHTSKDREGRPRGSFCIRWRAKGGTKCWSHGSAAPQVQAANARNVAVEKVEKEMARLGGRIDIDAGDGLEQVLGRLHAGVVRLGEDIQTAEHDPVMFAVQLGAYREWLVDMGRVAKTLLDAGLDERRERRETAVTVFQAGALAEDVDGALADVGMAQDVAERVRVALAARLRRRMEG